nr:hypothetical protein Iba_chr10eCG10000 [Ipomoea batatas]
MMRQRCKIDVQMCDDGEGTCKANPGVVVGVCVRSTRRNRADEQHCEPQAFTSGVEIGGSSHSTAWEQGTSSCPGTTYCYPHSQGSFGSNGLELSPAAVEFCEDEVEAALLSPTNDAYEFCCLWLNVLNAEIASSLDGKDLYKLSLNR